MTSDGVALSPPLRRAWFTAVAPELERQLPGAWEALAMAAVELTDDDELVVRIPTVYPLFKTVHKQVRTTVLDVLRSLLPDAIPCVVKFSTQEPKPVRRHPTGLDVYHWGDPHPDDWAELTAPLVQALAETDDPVRDVLARAQAAAVSQRAVWLQFPNDDARRAVGKTPGAAYALKTAVDSWRPGTHAAMYSDESGKTEPMTAD